MYTCHPLKCISCETEIKQKGQSPEDRKRKGIYNEIDLKLSNGSTMKVGICNICLPQASNLDHQAMLEAIKTWWRATIRPSISEALEAQIKDLKVLELVNA